MLVQAETEVVDDFELCHRFVAVLHSGWESIIIVAQEALRLVVRQVTPGNHLDLGVCAACRKKNLTAWEPTDHCPFTWERGLSPIIEGEIFIEGVEFPRQSTWASMNHSTSSFCIVERRV